jgi:hypothetical protein
VAGRHRDIHEIREAVALFLATLVGIVWAVTTIAGTFFNRPVDGQVHVIMLAVVTAFLGTAAIAGWKSNTNGKNGA